MNKRHFLTLTAACVIAGCSSNAERQHRDDTHGFKDVTSQSGIVTSNARSAGWGDYDNDGCVDLMISESESARLYQSQCDGTFKDVSFEAGISGPKGGFAVVWADFDNDDDLDVYVTSVDTGNSLYRNNGNGTFSDVASISGVADERSSTGAAWGDYDGDGDLDLYVANRFFSTPDSLITDRLYRNDGRGRFDDVGEALGVAVHNRKTFGIAWLDYDDNGTLDLYQAVDFGDDRLFSNDGKGGFTDVTHQSGITGPAHSMGLALGDLDGNGCIDVVSTNNTRGSADDKEHGPSTLYLNDCEGSFTDATGTWGMEDRGTVDWGVNMIDWDNDGDQDLSIVAGGMLKAGENETNVLYQNNQGRLRQVTRPMNALVDGAAFGSAWADYDRDGDLDWFIVNSKKPSVLLENHTAGGHHFLKVKLEGKENRDGVGARVEVQAGGRKYVRIIQAGKSFASSEELVAHFGLGRHDRVDVLLVRWPDGSQTRLEGLSVDRMIRVAQR
ncbi:MAG: CRTAC1 family protein [Gammaproteobacteria bacterium]|nr:CRTAC1 family protein [Gammaproteobacteria bacterium]